MKGGAWWLQAEDGRQGPYSEAELRTLVAEGQLSPEARVWSAESAGWSAIRDLKPTPGRRGAGALSVGLLVAVSAFFWATFGLVAYFMWNQQALPNWVWLRLDWLWPAAGIGLLSSVGPAALLWVRFANRNSRRPEFSAGVQAAAILISVAAVGMGAGELQLSRFMIDSVVASRAWTYSVEVDPATNRIFITGAVGPGFADAVNGALAQVGSPAYVEIESEGGMTDEALNAARAIEAKGGVTVLVRRFCASACTLVLMAGEIRAADYDGVLAFHATSPLVETENRFIRWRAAQAGRLVDQYLMDRGVPQAIIEEANRIGADDLHILTAVEARRLEMLSGLVFGDVVLTAEQEAELPRLMQPDPER